MKVTRVRTESGSSPVPRLDDSWSPLEKLEWKASLAEHDTGLRIRVTPGKAWRNKIRIHGVFDVQVENSIMGCGDYRDTWTYINGVVTGAQQKGRVA